MSLNQPTEWVVDYGASSHITPTTGNITPSSLPSAPSSIIVGDGSVLPVIGSGHKILPYNFQLRDILVAPDLIKSLISVRRFTTDNCCSIEFDPFGLSVKDLHARNVIIRCDSPGPLYTIQLLPSPTQSPALLAASLATLWHRRLGHPGREDLHKLASSSFIPCNRVSSQTICQSCQLGHHTRLSFSTSTSRASKAFDLVHCDLWTSPIPNVSGTNIIL